MQETSRFGAVEDVVWRRLPDDWVCLKSSESSFFGSDALGACIWELICDGASLGEITTELVDRYELERSTAWRDLTNFVACLLDQRLITPFPTTALESKSSAQDRSK